MVLFFFNLNTISVITVLLEKGPNTGNTTLSTINNYVMDLSGPWNEVKSYFFRTIDLEPLKLPVARRGTNF